jgi:hypothetical protein
MDKKFICLIFNDCGQKILGSYDTYELAYDDCHRLQKMNPSSIIHIVKSGLWYSTEQLVKNIDNKINEFQRYENKINDNNKKLKAVDELTKAFDRLYILSKKRN